MPDRAGWAAATQHHRLVLARHGQTTWNVEGRFQGQADPPLDATGWVQAERLASALVGLRPDVLVSSDLLRALQTASTVSVACGLEVTVDPALREVDLGGWEGLYRHQAAERFPDEHRAWSEGGDPRRGGGESQDQAGVRAAASVRRILGTDTDGATVVIVAHGLVLQRAMELLVADGTIELAGVPPHLENGEWIILDATAPT
ncbi:MAG: histidine phosphatase family protein [Actinomycetota bacterium]|nr:histidine phosphatase family protein [Actinomycetota bacterium]